MHGANRLSGPEEAFISGIANDINDRLEVVSRKSEELSQVKKEIEEIEENISRLLIQAGNISEETMKKNNSDVHNMYRKKGEIEKDIKLLEDDLKELKKQIITLAQSMGGPSNEEVMTIIKQYAPSGNPNALRDIEKAKELLGKIKELNNK